MDEDEDGDDVHHELQLTSLRITYDELEFRFEDFMPEVTSLEFLLCRKLSHFMNLERFEGLECLYASATLDNFRYLVNRLKNGPSHLKQIRLSPLVPHNSYTKQQCGSEEGEEWELAKVELEVACKAHGVQLEFRSQQCFSAVEFWEETTTEEFLISGFEDSDHRRK